MLLCKADAKPCLVLAVLFANYIRTARAWNVNSCTPFFCNVPDAQNCQICKDRKCLVQWLSITSQDCFSAWNTKINHLLATINNCL